MGNGHDGEDTLLQGYDKIHLKLGSHGLFLLKSDAQWPLTLHLLTSAGIQHREVCGVFAPEERIQAFVNTATKTENALRTSIEKKQLQFFPSCKAEYGFQFEMLYTTLKELVLDASRMKQQGVRAIVDMNWYLKESSSAKLLSFEHEMQELLDSREFPLTLICTYDLRKIDGLLTMDLLDLHPNVIYGNVEEEPPFFVRVATRLFKDPLTGLHNIRYLQERLEEEMDREKRYGGRFSILLIDIDGFQRVNDKFGYIRGDRVLKEVAKLLKATVRKVDLVCRYGDDSFTILLPETSKEGAQVSCSRITQALKKIRLKDLNLSVSIGTTTFPDDGKTKETLFQKAAKALKAFKNSRGELPVAGHDRPPLKARG